MARGDQQLHDFELKQAIEIVFKQYSYLALAHFTLQ